MTRNCSLAIVFVLLFIGFSFAQGMPQEVRDQIDNNVIGEWGLTVTYDGETSKGSWKVKWSTDDKHSTIAQAKTKNAAGETQTFTAIGGWDAQANAFRERGFDSNGETWMILWTEFTSKKWTGQSTGIFQGKPSSGICTSEYKGDSLTYRETMHGKPFVFKAVRRR